MQFLLEGVRLGERCLYVSLSETKDELDAVARMVLDSLSEMRLMSQSTLRYRREILRLKQHLAGGRCTVAGRTSPCC